MGVAIMEDKRRTHPPTMRKINNDTHEHVN